MTDNGTSTPAVGEASSTNPQAIPVANVNSNEDKEIKDKCENPPHDKYWIIADIVSAALKVCTGIMLIIGARFLYHYANDGGIEFDSGQEKEERDIIDNLSGVFFIAGTSSLLLTTIFDLLKEWKLGAKHLIAHILAICGIYFWWVGSLQFFPEVKAKNHYNADSILWITGAVLLIIAQVTMFDAYYARDPRGNFAKFAALSFALLGSILILSGAILLLGRNSASDGDHIKGAECYIAGAVFYLVYGILDGLALVIG